MTFWNKKEYSPIGLDIASTAIRGVQLAQQGESILLHSALEVPVESMDLLEAQSVHSEEKLSHAIAHLMDLGGFKGRDVTIHCPVDKLAQRPISIPSGPEGLPRNTILDILKHQLADHIPFATDKAVIDYSIVNHDTQSRQLNLMTMVADGEWIEKQILMLRALKLNCISVDPMPSTLTRLANHAGLALSDNELVAILDIGYSGTTLIVSYAGTPIFCRRFSLGAREMNQTLSQHLMIDPTQAQKLNIEFGLQYQNDEQQSTDQHIAKTIYTALQNKLDDFTESVIRSLNYVISQQRDARMNRLLLSGTASHTHQLSNYLADQLEIPVTQITHPSLTDITNALPTSRSTSGSWCVATGLALSAFATEQTPADQSSLEVA